ncbi:MAG TPA: hypothetical protein VEA80_19100 [Vitreimonas sp.]|uniref:hypothetical protein n=1 Tax=Vitreimonas sp. TaxID=3069702 RepID=UPI002D4EE05C|nr:hypothetical protein [Vitreimonas sp.]HYD89596.1 hypothetical protein [Vitreimonas sp.]
MRLISIGAALAVLVSSTAVHAETTLRTEGDFDGDGLRDTAALEVDAERFRLVVRRGAAPEAPIVVREGPRERVGDFLGTRPAGVYETFPFDDRRETVATRHDGISFGSREASEGLIYWTGAEFRTVWLSD